MRIAISRLAAGIVAATAWIPAAGQWQLRPTIVFVSTRDNPAGGLQTAAEIYLVEY